MIDYQSKMEHDTEDSIDTIAQEKRQSSFRYFNRNFWWFEIIAFLLIVGTVVWVLRAPEYALSIIGSAVGVLSILVAVVIALAQNQRNSVQSSVPTQIVVNNDATELLKIQEYMEREQHQKELQLKKEQRARELALKSELERKEQQMKEELAQKECLMKAELALKNKQNELRRIQREKEEALLNEEKARKAELRAKTALQQQNKESVKPKPTKAVAKTAKVGTSPSKAKKTSSAKVASKPKVKASAKTKKTAVKGTQSKSAKARKATTKNSAKK